MNRRVADLSKYQPIKTENFICIADAYFGEQGILQHERCYYRTYPTAYK